MDNEIADEVFDDIIEADFNDLCRICGSTSDSPLVPIYEDNGYAEDLAGKIMLYLPIKVSEEDVLPVKICVNCTNGVLTWHLLYECCVDTDRKFQTMLSEEVLQSPKSKAKWKEDQHATTVGENVNETSREEAEMEDVMFLRAEFGPEDEQYLEEETRLVDGELDTKNGEMNTTKHRIFKSRQQHQCNFCKEVHTSKDLLTDHLRNKHYNQIFHCDVCNEYKDQNDLIAHMTQHALNSLLPEQKQHPTKTMKPKTKIVTSATNNKLKCKKCDKVFSSLSGVRYHMNSTHAKMKNFKCDKCLKVFSCKRILDNHMKSIHSKKKMFQCELCDKVFKTDSALYSHKKIHANVFPYECEKCGKTFRFKHHHVSHLEIHNMVKQYACKVCNKQFYAQNNLSKHLKTHENTIEYTCHICNIKMKQRRYLYEHMKRVHQPVLSKANNYGNNCNHLTLFCYVCSQEIENSEENVATHIENALHSCDIKCKECVTPWNVHKCEICHKVFSTRLEMATHRSRHKDIFCIICLKAFKKYSTFNAHRKMHDEPHTVHSCPICDYNSHRKYNIQLHVKGHAQDFPCKICCNSFNSEQILENHKASHSKTELLNYNDHTSSVLCSECDNRFDSKFKLYNHALKEHNGDDERFFCSQCGRGFDSFAILRNHEKSHNKEFYKCKECGKTFTKVKTFIEHKNTHLDSRPFECNICFMRFNYSSNLSQHRGIHRGAKNFVCHYCDRKFTRSNTLNVHLKSHRNERNFVCQHCDCTFVQSSTLQKHMRALHKKCETCGEVVGDRKQFQIHLWKDCSLSKQSDTNIKLVVE